ncbi:hypothetical protein [Halorussus halobius]|uniref:hypothetical protein n=1 Tax=Halorussus halobius TaxID=1710537 RepID=UPI001092B71B|nr:hypothetical protein [Halorussus halobius]
MGDSSSTRRRSGTATHRDTALTLLELDFVVATVLVAGVAFVATTRTSTELDPFLNAASVLGSASIVVSTALALLLVVETTFVEVTEETGWLHDHLTGLVGVTVVVTGWSLPLFATGAIVGHYGGWDLPSAASWFVALLALLYAVPTVYLFRRSYFARFGYPSNSPQSE